MTRLSTKESADAVRHIRSILMSADDHGVVDIFAKFKQREIWASMYALGRLQHAARFYDMKQERKIQPVTDHALLEDLAHYAVFATAAYGWPMDAMRPKKHWKDFFGKPRSDLDTLIHRTNIEEDDILEVEWESKTHRPAYFLVRDKSRKRIVLCIRGTWSPHDVLTDMCCTADEMELPPSSMMTKVLHGRPNRTIRAHHGMLEAARCLRKATQKIVQEELKARPDYSLTLVGHSLGGGIAALLGILWQDLCPNLAVYVYGAPCVLTEGSKCNVNIVSVIGEQDPFQCLSLGHVADLTKGLSILCERPDLRREILDRVTRTRRFRHMREKDLQWCSTQMKKLQEQMQCEKFFPPGRILLLMSDNNGRRKQTFSLHEVPPSNFQSLLIRPRMFDLTPHIPVRYVARLRDIADRSGRVVGS